jgi:hypothetical protein
VEKITSKNKVRMKVQNFYGKEFLGLYKNTDATGAKAPQLERPICDGMVLRGPDIPVMLENQCAPAPQRWQGWRKGGFSQELKISRLNVTISLFLLRDPCTIIT